MFDLELFVLNFKDLFLDAIRLVTACFDEL